MSQAPEDLLLAARTQVETLQRDFQAQSELLNEESATVTSLRGEVAILTAEIGTLKAERDSAKAETTAMQSRIADLQASQADFDTRVQTEVARVVASTGTTFPARVTPAGDPQQAPNISVSDLIARYDELVSANKPEEAAKFYQQHLAQLLTRT
ncbi:MAG: hypothetical protein EOP83_20465, partial [Verrucomicrobiaceae bacterium]